MGSKGLVVLVAVAFLGGCEPGGSGAVPAPKPSPSSPYVYECGGSVFAPALLEGPGLEQDDPELQDLVESLGRSNPAKDAWRIVSDDGGRVGLMARKRRGFEYAVFLRSGDRWVPDEFGRCKPEVVVGRRAPVDWGLDSKPAPNDTELMVLASERSCQGGRKLTQRNTRFDVDYGEDAVTIVATTRPAVGGNCIGSPWPLVVRLDEPLGDRELLDAGIYPPQIQWPLTGAQRGPE